MPVTLSIELISERPDEGRIEIRDDGGNLVPHAFDPDSGLHLARPAPGRHEVRVVAALPEADYREEVREVSIGTGRTALTFFPVPLASPPQVLLRSGDWRPFRGGLDLLMVFPNEGESILDFAVRVTPLLLRLLVVPPGAPTPQRLDRAVSDWVRRLPPARPQAAAWAQALTGLWARVVGRPVPPEVAQGLTALTADDPPPPLHLPWRSNDLETLRLARAGGPAGPTIELGSRWAALGHEATVKLQPGAARAQLDVLIRGLPVLARGRAHLLHPELIQLEFQPDTGAEAATLTYELRANHRDIVASADLEVILPPEADGVSLSPVQWTLPRMRVPEAHARLLQDALPNPTAVAVALVDGAFAGITHGELAQRLDTSLLSSVPNAIPRQASHGTLCAGVLAAANDGQGTTGVAPTARVIPVVPNTGRPEVTTKRFEQAANLQPLSDNGFLEVPADVYSCSVVVSGSGIDAGIKATLERLARRGRGGRGCAVFTSAGNDASQSAELRPLGTSATVRACGATTLDDADREVHAAYSNQGVAFCALSSTLPGSSLMSHRPVLSIRRPAADAPPIEVKESSASTLTFAAGSAIEARDFLAVGSMDGPLVVVTGVLHATPMLEVTYVPCAPSTSDQVVNALRVDPAASVTEAPVVHVASGTSFFGGTSAAAPQVAGVAALMLEANPELPFTEIYEILAESAVRQVVDDKGDALVVGEAGNALIGFGRIDAAEAVGRAIAQRGEDRHARLSLVLLEDTTQVDGLARGAQKPKIRIDIELPGVGLEPPPQPTPPFWVRLLALRGDQEIPNFPEGWDNLETEGGQVWQVRPHLLGEVPVGRVHGYGSVSLDWPTLLIPPVGEVIVLAEIYPKLGQARSFVVNENPNLYSVQWVVHEGAPRPTAPWVDPDAPPEVPPPPPPLL